jgi:hypothetical protein
MELDFSPFFHNSGFLLQKKDWDRLQGMAKIPSSFKHKRVFCFGHAVSYYCESCVPRASITWLTVDKTMGRG